eukprot:10644248-Alexandrium_andersonii.AAC.1
MSWCRAACSDRCSCRRLPARHPAARAALPQPPLAGHCCGSHVGAGLRDCAGSPLAAQSAACGCTATARLQAGAAVRQTWALKQLWQTQACMNGPGRSLARSALVGRLARQRRCLL